MLDSRISVGNTAWDGVGAWWGSTVIDCWIAVRDENTTSSDNAFAPSILVKAVCLKGPVPLNRIAGKHLEVAIHHGAKPANHDAAHRVAGAGMSIPKSVSESNGIEVVHFVHERT